MALVPAAAHAQQQLALMSPVRTAMVTVTLGKSQDVHTDRSLSDIMVGDPSVADVNPLTDHSLSILGKKIGTTRVTVYDADKKPVGIFDVEVSYDVSQLAAEISQFTGGGIKVSSINGRIMLSGTAPDAATLDKAVMIARQFAPDPINTVQVMQQQQVELDVRFIEASRQASRELGVQWNYFGNSALANVGNQLPAQQLPITQAGGAFQQPGATLGGPSTIASNITGTPLSPVAAAGVLSGSAPFGFLVGQLTNRLQVAINALEQNGLARSLAEPNLVALSGDTASFLAGGQFPVPEAGAPWHGLVRLPAIWRRTLLHADRAQGRPDQPGDQAGGERDRHHAYGDRRRHFGTRTDHAQSLDHAGIARRSEFPARRPVAE